MKDKIKKVKVKNSKSKAIVEQYRNFLWTLQDVQPINDKKTVFYFKRGDSELIDKKAKKAVVAYEKSYKCLKRKKYPLTAIIFGILTGVFAALAYTLKVQEIVKVNLIATYAICASCAGIALLFWIVIMIRKKAMMKRCVEYAQTYNVLLPGEITPCQQDPLVVNSRPIPNQTVEENKANEDEIK